VSNAKAGWALVTPASSPDELRSAPARTWTPTEVARAWDVRVNTVRKLLAAGELGFIRVGDLIKIRSADLATFHERHQR